MPECKQYIASADSDTFDSSEAAIYAVGRGDRMFRHKKDLHVLALSATEKRLLIQAMIHFRNKLIDRNKSTEGVNGILLRLI